MAAQPNILILMADQMAPSALPIYGHALVKAPNIARLAAQGVVFDSAYCNSPLCAPSRFSFLSGLLPSRIGAYDNACEVAAGQPTIAHDLRYRGYRTILAGKMPCVIAAIVRSTYCALSFALHQDRLSASCRQNMVNIYLIASMSRCPYGSGSGFCRGL